MVAKKQPSKESTQRKTMYLNIKYTLWAGFERTFQSEIFLPPFNFYGALLLERNKKRDRKQASKQARNVRYT